MDEFRKNIIIVFMDEAKRKQDIRDGLGKTKVPETISYSVGLIETFIAFEAFTRGELEKETASDGQIEFCEKYKNFIKNIYSSFSKEIENLYEELKNEPLKDMGRLGNNDKLSIKDKEDMKSIFKVMYRVRSNVVHGGKEMELPRNEILIKNSFFLLYKLIDSFFKEQGIY